MTGPRYWMAQLRIKNEVLALRRQALAEARSLIESTPEAEKMTAEQIELAACDLCDEQMKELQTTSEDK